MSSYGCGERGQRLSNSNPVPFTTTSHPGSLCRKACVEAPRPTRRVKPEPEPNWPKVCVITSSIIIAKALPFVRCTLRTSLLRLPIRRQRRPSLPRLPDRCKNHHGYPPAQRAPHGPRGKLQASAPGGGCIRKKAPRPEPRSSCGGDCALLLGWSFINLPEQTHTRRGRVPHGSALTFIDHVDITLDNRIDAVSLCDQTRSLTRRRIVLGGRSASRLVLFDYW